ncbi:hypothetical protein TNCV_3008521 [Trichonephila clavipes]|nr:hypothetical protein TNCV_3008521 [Trichonephila clavipes]
MPNLCVLDTFVKDVADGLLLKLPYAATEPRYPMSDPGLFLPAKRHTGHQPPATFFTPNCTCHLEGFSSSGNTL